jgi:dimethylamine monooxygenase subunit B
MKVRIRDIVVLSPSLKRFVFEAVEGTLPPAAAGAHVIVHVPGTGRVLKNAYSLVGAPHERRQYEIIVRRTQNSRGGSAWLHAQAAAGAVLEIGPPQNFFAPVNTAGRHLLLSAGIGITPFLAYAKVLSAPFELHHCCKLAEAPAFAALLPRGANVTLHTSRQSLDVPRLLAAQKLDTHVYVCGPDDFMEAVLATALQSGWPAVKLHQERFGGAGGGKPFTVVLQRSGLRLEVGPDESLLEALEAADLPAPCLCRGGACGACELPVLAGIPEHHDHVLDAARRAANDAILTCVSRAKTPELVLDF